MLALDTPWFALDPGSGLIRDFGGDLDLVDVSPAGLRGQHWRSALAFAVGETVIDRLLSVGTSCSLPVLLLGTEAGHEQPVGGSLHRVTDELVVLRLWPETCTALPAADINASDVVVVLGADHLTPDVAASGELLAAIAASLPEILRVPDIASPPGLTAIAVVLRDVDGPEAVDLCRAMLSHLHRGIASPARLCIGLSRVAEAGSAQRALLAAHHALCLARLDGSGEPIRQALPADEASLAAAQLSAAGVFAARPVGVDAAPASVATGKPAPPAAAPAAPPVVPMERDIDGYVVDNMEGAVDQAMFLARFDLPVAIIGPAGTGKLYIARIIHEQGGASPDMFVPLDCREFRSRKSANTRINRELQRGAGKTLVFKSPYTMHPEAQQKLARQISSRTLADTSPRQALPAMKLVALFPERLETLIRKGQLDPALASAFAGYPIEVPPIRDRKQAVLRWAHKILQQEGASRDRDMKGFTPDAERAMLTYEWPGNISEMRQCIRDALDRTPKDWLTPVDLGLFKGLDPDGGEAAADSQPFLVSAQQVEGDAEPYTPSAFEALNAALGEAVHALLEHGIEKPLGQWLEDDMVTAALDRYRGDTARAAEFLGTRPRNIGRWQAKIAARESERNASALWQEPRRRVREWIRETPPAEQPLLELAMQTLLAHVSAQAVKLSVAKRASVMGVSTPTYNKRLRELDDARATAEGN